MTTSDHAAHLKTLTNHELLAMHVAVQSELKRRGITRTDVTTGEALRMFGDTLVPAGTKARDLIDSSGRRVQVKTRVKNRAVGKLKVPPS